MSFLLWIPILIPSCAVPLAAQQWGRTSLGFGFSYSHTVAQYRVTEVRSGATGTISPFAPLGIGTQLIFRW